MKSEGLGIKNVVSKSSLQGRRNWPPVDELSAGVAHEINNPLGNNFSRGPVDKTYIDN